MIEAIRELMPSIKNGRPISLVFLPERLRAIHQYNELIMRCSQEILLITARMVENAPSASARGFFKDLNETLKSIIDENILKRDETEPIKHRADRDARRGRKMLVTWLRRWRNKMERLAHKTASYIAEIVGHKLPKLCHESEKEMGILPPNDYNPFTIHKDDEAEKLVVVTSQPALARILSNNARAIRTLRTLHEKMLWLEGNGDFPPDTVCAIYAQITPITIALEQINIILEKVFFEHHNTPFDYREDVEEVEQAIMEAAKPPKAIQQFEYNRT